MKRVVRVGNRRIEYTLIQSTRKNVLLQALPEGVTRVYAPQIMSLRDIDAFVRQNVEHLDLLHQRIDQKIDESLRAHPVSEGTSLSVEGILRTLYLHTGTVRAEITDEDFHLWLPTPEKESAVRTALRATLSQRALARFRERLTLYHPRIGGQYGRVTVREQRTRWGSCSSKHNLNFNWKLIMAPPQALDYVVIHELCHLHEFNHSPRFWKLVEAQMPDYEVWKKWLKVHGSELGIE